MISLLTRTEVATLLAVTPWTVDDLRRRGVLASVELGPRRHRYRVADIEQLINDRRRAA